MKLFYIFLDVDGVLNNEDYFYKCFKRHKVRGIMSMNSFPFDPKCLNNLMKLNLRLKKMDFDVKIILTSTWRLRNVDYAILNSRLAEYGMRIFDKTIYLNSGNRGLEIKEFLNSHKRPTHYLIIDDEILDIQKIFEKKHIIKTSFKKGFNRKKLKEATRKVFFCEMNKSESLKY